MNEYAIAILIRTDGNATDALTTALDALRGANVEVAAWELHDDPDAILSGYDDRDDDEALGTCPYCDVAAFTDERGCCVHCGAPRGGDNEALARNLRVAYEPEYDADYGVVIYSRDRRDNVADDAQLIPNDDNQEIRRVHVLALRAQTRIPYLVRELDRLARELESMVVKLTAVTDYRELRAAPPGCTSCERDNGYWAPIDRRVPTLLLCRFCYEVCLATDRLPNLKALEYHHQGQYRKAHEAVWPDFMDTTGEIPE